MMVALDGKQSPAVPLYLQKPKINGANPTYCSVEPPPITAEEVPSSSKLYSPNSNLKSLISLTRDSYVMLVPVYVEDAVLLSWSSELDMVI